MALGHRAGEYSPGRSRVTRPGAVWRALICMNACSEISGRQGYLSQQRLNEILFTEHKEDNKIKIYSGVF